MPNVIETWGRDHPVMLTLASVIIGALISAVPVGALAYIHGRDDGVAATETKWQKDFATKVTDEVKKQVPVEFKNELDNANAQIKAKEDENKRLAEANQALQQQLQDLQRDAGHKTAIYDLYDNLVRNANRISSSFAGGQTARARINFRALILQIHDAHERAGRWTSLFDEQATKLYDRIQRGEEISDPEMKVFLAYFAQDAEQRRRVVDELAEAANQARVIRD